MIEGEGKLIGSVDRFEPPRMISGWVRNTERTGFGRDITVRIRRGTEILAEGPLSLHRRDIVEDKDYVTGFQLSCSEDIPDEVFAFALLTIEAFDQEGRSAHLPIYDRCRSLALERTFSAGPSIGRFSASTILNYLAKSDKLPKEAREALLELNDKFFDEEERKLLYQFESLGRDCSLGGIQRAFGAEPLGLWRFSAIDIDKVTAALADRLNGIGSPEFTKITVGKDGEYGTKDTRYFMWSHTFVYEGKVDFDDFFRKQCQKIQFLVRNMREKLEAGERTLVVHALPDEIPESKLRTLFKVIQEIGPSRLLYLQLATESCPPGTVIVRPDGIFSGYVLPIQGELMKPRAEVRAGWIGVLRKVHSMLASHADTARGTKTAA